MNIIWWSTEEFVNRIVMIIITLIGIIIEQNRRDKGE